MRYEALPWISIFVVVLLVLGFLAWITYGNWHELEDIVK
jgi:hypothetical protein